MEGPVLQIIIHASEEELDHGEGGGVGDGAGVGEGDGQVGVAVAGVVNSLLLSAAPVLIVTITHVIPIVAS